MIILYVHFCATLMMTGLIWLIQLVHYPSFYYIDIKRFRDFELFHAKTITYIVAPLMIIELLTSLVLIAQPHRVSNISAVLTGLTWLSTIILSMPLHSKLTKAYSKITVRKLILTNWPRTILWSAKAIFLGHYLSQQLPL